MTNTKKILFSIIFVSSFILSINAQTTHIVETSGNSFSPADLTVEVGDIVEWRNTSQGLHNVVADDGSFTSGSPSTSNWTFQFVFDEVGDNPYYCEIHGAAGGIGMSGVVHVNPVTGVEDDSKKYDYRLDQNYPNPFNPSTTISYAVSQTSKVKLTIFDILGNEVSRLVNDVKTAGEYNVNWTAQNLASGIYMLQLEAISLENNTNFINVKKMILMK